MTSETRTFTNVPGSYALSYAYNLASELTSITNQSGAQVGYTYDQAGRPTGVSGSGYANGSDYVTSLAYRAFGLKQMSYTNGRTLSVQYDNRMRPTQWSIPGVLRMQYSYTCELSGRLEFARNLDDESLDRWFAYDHVGGLISSRSGNEARLAIGEQVPLLYNGPYSHNYHYDQWGNITQREGWGGPNPQWSSTYTNNKSDEAVYDQAGNMIGAAGGWAFTYDATGQQATSAIGNVVNVYDGDRLRGKKTEYGGTTYYLRSTVLGGQVVAELDHNGNWMRGYVYLGGELIAVQYAGVNWVHQDPLVKSKRITNNLGNVVSAVELDPWGGETNHSSNLAQAFQPKKFTSYIRDAIGSDDAMHRRYNNGYTRFEQPDPYNGSYNLTNPQSFNRYSYVHNDPVNFVDPSGLDELGPPPPPPTQIDRIITNTWAQRYFRGGGILGGDGMPIPEEGPEAGGDLGGALGQLQNTQTQQPCTFNVNISGVSGDQLTDMQSEIRRIFGTANLNVVFGRPGQGNAGSMNIVVTPQFIGQAAAILGDKVNDTSRLGVTVVGSGESQVNSTHIFINQGGGMPARPANFASYGTIYGRVGAHEVITHGFIPTRLDSFFPADIRTPWRRREGLSRGGTRFDISDSTAAALRARCP